MKPWVCVSIQSKTNEQTVKDVKTVGDDADLIEIRLDYRGEPLDLSSIVAASKVPLIGTNRRVDQGGKAEEPESDRIQLLLDAVEAGFTYVDIASTTENINETVAVLKANGSKVIASYHDFDNPLSYAQLEERFDELKNTGCDVIKIIGWTGSIQDNLPYVKFNREHPGNVFFGMGEMGVTSRIIAPLSGAMYTYASLAEGKELAAGQVPLSLLKEIYGRITL